MAAAMNNGALSDEEWLISRARSYMKIDSYAAKAWLITARSLFPRNISIQFEQYALEKSGRNVSDAAHLLQEMFQTFPQNPQLWAEIHTLLEAMQSDATDARTQLHTEIFAAIPTQVQCQMLLIVAETISDILEQCRLLLLAMRKFPNLVTEHGLKLVETLLNVERGQQGLTPVNCYRKLLVCDVLPLVLDKCRLDLSSKQLYKWLQKAIEFYISYVTQPPSQEDGSVLNPGGDLLSPSKKSLLTKKYPSIIGLPDKESIVLDPWRNLFKLLLQIGKHLNWEMEPNLFTSSRETQWQHVLSICALARQTGSDLYHKQVLHTTTVLFLECLYTYVSHVDTEIFAGGGSSLAVPVASGGSSLAVPVVLIEGFNANQEHPTEPKIKKLRPDGPIQPHIHPSSSVPNAPNIIQNFVTALKCYELLHTSGELQRDFIKLCQNWKMETWSWMGHFQTDMFIYKGAFQEAVAHIQTFATDVSEKLQTRNQLQLACCFFCLGSYARSCELILDVINALPNVQLEPRGDADMNPTSTGPGRQLLLTACIEKEILPYSIQLLLSCFRERAFSSHSDDTCLGHVIVLLQYDWSKHEQLFSDVIRRIKRQGSFTYNIFFTYVTNVDILEEFAFLENPEGGKINLDILPTSTKVIAQQRTVTRGLNKEVKEDFRATMEKQVRHSEEPIEKVIRRFLQDEKQLLLQTV